MKPPSTGHQERKRRRKKKRQRGQGWELQLVLRSLG
jgi:hypothetical protein